jgi:hypothetical protein
MDDGAVFELDTVTIPTFVNSGEAFFASPKGKHPLANN